MNDFLLYALKVNGALMLFYLFYMLLYRRDTFWKIRRAYLLIAILFSFLYPLVQFGAWFQEEETVQVFVSAVNLNEIIVMPVKQTVEPVFSVENILLAVYVLIAFALMFKIVMQVFSILIKSVKGEKSEYEGMKMIQLNENITPFSFFNLIFINKNLHTGEELPEILTHELSHVRQRHSYDVVLSEMLTALCWFNPFAWLLKKELKQNLEFLADNQVIVSGFEAKKYQYLLLNISCNYVDNQLINQFNISPIKKRITMMNKQKTSRKGLIKYTLIIPVALVMLIVSNAQHVVANINETLQNQNKKTTVSPIVKVSVEPVKPSVTKKQPAPKPDVNGVYDVVDVPPVYPNGEEALMKFLMENIKYPVKAQEKNIQGRVIVQFIVDETGKVMEPKVVRGVDPSLDAEALRVVQQMPDWTPGQNKGKNVNVNYFVPIVFRLGDNKGNKTQVRTEISTEKGKTSVVKFTEPTIKKDEKVYEVADVPPSFPGGEAALMKYLFENVKYPVISQENGIMGKVIVMFVVDANGNIGQAEIVKSDVKTIAEELTVVGYSKKTNEASKTPAKKISKEDFEKSKKALETEALRVVNNMPTWIPGKQGGESVRVKYFIPINFKLQ